MIYAFHWNFPHKIHLYLFFKKPWFSNNLKFCNATLRFPMYDKVYSLLTLSTAMAQHKNLDT